MSGPSACLASRRSSAAHLIFIYAGEVQIPQIDRIGLSAKALNVPARDQRKQDLIVDFRDRGLDSDPTDQCSAQVVCDYGSRVWWRRCLWMPTSGRSASVA